MISLHDRCVHETIVYVQDGAWDGYVFKVRMLCDVSNADVFWRDVRVQGDLDQPSDASLERL